MQGKIPVSAKIVGRIRPKGRNPTFSGGNPVSDYANANPTYFLFV